MDIIQDRVAGAGFRQNGGKLRLPDTLGQPRTGGAFAEVFFDVVGQASDLFVLIRWRNGNQNRFIESAADYFYLAGLRQRSQFLKVFRVIFFDPSEQRPGVV